MTVARAFATRVPVTVSLEYHRNKSHPITLQCLDMAAIRTLTMRNVRRHQHQEPLSGGEYAVLCSRLTFCWWCSRGRLDFMLHMKAHGGHDQQGNFRNREAWEGIVQYSDSRYLAVIFLQKKDRYTSPPCKWSYPERYWGNSTVPKPQQKQTMRK